MYAARHDRRNQQRDLTCSDGFAKVKVNSSRHHYRFLLDDCCKAHQVSNRDNVQAFVSPGSMTDEPCHNGSCVLFISNISIQEAGRYLATIEAMVSIDQHDVVTIGENRDPVHD